VWELTRADWDWTLGVNFFGVLHGLQAFVPQMLAHGEPGHVVNTASIAAFLPGGGPYGVSKAGVLALSESLWSDLRARNAKIGASVLCPG
jgi:NAD(P)-dependent dehydrogenase (short-subunit alcohol dehydrogenase family)